MANTFVEVDYVRGITAHKPCKHGEYERFEHLLFLSIIPLEQ